MKKNTFALTATILLLLPTLTHAQEGLLAMEATTTISVVENEETATTTPTIKSFTVCSQEAIEKRDTNIATSRSAYNVTMTNALNERKNREKAAVAIEDLGNKKEAIKLSADTYKNQTKVAQNTLTQARKSIWQTFENDIKRCREIEDQLVKRTNSEKATTTEEKVAPAARSMMMKTVVEEPETKTIKETIKTQIETFFSLFN